ncbi:transporter substrate-binding domain-containing protein [Variovorax sp. UMC13]|uniref:transporter substrate-binding domain-containing protein n=1 Tax=Variovorax sp. UMC13 TaxID=1862326 RepID=UPI00160115C1|nr:transporter substrate-binding domain-containing protein [Variovorax sp. UMC13]MBB1601923.1 amino acid ABC transporter substrate-binding protein [Variovorax sp. UMC13]
MTPARAPAREGWKVGLLFSTTSLTAAVEATQAQATRLAIEEVNAAGGIDGVPLLPVAIEAGATPEAYREAALQLCDLHQVPVIFGTHMSSTRKAVLPVVESRRTLLFYPTLYEGFEYSPFCIYTGAAPNQNSVPLARHMLERHGGRVLFVGGQYVYPYESNRIMRTLFEQAGGSVLDEIYLPLQSSHEDFMAVMDRVRALAPDAIYSTVVGSDTLRFYEAYQSAGFDPARMPIASLATNEADAAAMRPGAAEGHLSAAPWFATLDTPASQRFVASYGQRFGPDAPITAGAEAAYFQVHLFAEAARRAGGAQRPDALLEALGGLGFEAPQGHVRIDAESHHTWLWPRIARIAASGRFEIIASASEAVRPSPYMIDHTLQSGVQGDDSQGA